MPITTFKLLMRTVVLILITLGGTVMSTSCTDGDSGDSASEVADTPALPTCAQIAAVLKDFIEADSLEPVNLVLTQEDIENGTTCMWKDVPTGKSVLVGASFGSYSIDEIRNWPAEQPLTEPESYIMESGEPGHQDEIFVINDGSATVYEPGCEVNLTYFAPTFTVQFIGHEYVIDQAKDVALRVAALMR